MTADIINLKRVRKAKARAAKEGNAAVNRAAFGRTKVERGITAAEAVREGKVLDGACRTPDPQAANEGSFPATAGHDDDDGLDPGNVS